MDHFGIGSGVSGAAHTYFQASRRTGRTRSLVEIVKDGDRVVFLTEREARRVQHLCKERGVSIEVVVCDPRTPERLLRRGNPSHDERMIFDHNWIEQFYLNAIQQAADDIDRLQTQMSGRGLPHMKTKKQAEEFAKWRR